MVPYRFTVDVDGGDFGGRTEGQRGLKEGLDLILMTFKMYKTKALFFVSTELLREYKREIRHILEEGHEIGSHGHFHIKYKDKWRAEEDRRISNTLLLPVTGSPAHRYRAPKFSYRTDDLYSNPKNHIGLLKHMWFGQKIRENSIIYLHPFDLVNSGSPPNLFCRLWYSNPQRAYETLLDLLNYHR